MNIYELTFSHSFSFQDSGGINFFFFFLCATYRVFKGSFHNSVIELAGTKLKCMGFG